VDSPSVVNDKEAPAMAEAIRLLPKLFDAETIRAPEFATSLLKSDNDYVWSLGVAIKVAAWDFVSWQRVRQMFPDLPADQLAVKADELNREQRKRTLEELSKMAQTDHRKKWLKHLSEKFLPNDKAK
jgi:hypothetical protein